MARSRSHDQNVLLANRLHATLLNQIAALVAQSQVCESVVSAGDARSFAEVARLRDMLRSLEEATREIIETAIDSHNATLTHALQAELEALRRKHPEIRVDSSLGGAGTVRAKWLARLIVDVVHEALTNAARHGRPSQLHLVVSAAAGGILVRVRDNGRGFDARAAGRGTSTASGHYGIRIMQESANSAQGRLEISSAPGKGTQVTLFVPVS